MPPKVGHRCGVGPLGHNTKGKGGGRGINCGKGQLHIGRRLKEKTFHKLDHHPYRRRHILDANHVAEILLMRFKRGMSPVEIQNYMYTKSGVAVTASNLRNILEGRRWKDVLPKVRRYRNKAKSRITDDMVLAARVLFANRIPQRVIKLMIPEFDRCDHEYLSKIVHGHSRKNAPGPITPYGTDTIPYGDGYLFEGKVIPWVNLIEEYLEHPLEEPIKAENHGKPQPWPARGWVTRERVEKHILKYDPETGEWK